MTPVPSMITPLPEIGCRYPPLFVTQRILTNAVRVCAFIWSGVFGAGISAEEGTVGVKTCWTIDWNICRGEAFCSGVLVAVFCTVDATGKRPVVSALCLCAAGREGTMVICVPENTCHTSTIPTTVYASACQSNDTIPMYILYEFIASVSCACYDSRTQPSLVAGLPAEAELWLGEGGISSRWLQLC